MEGKRDGCWARARTIGILVSFAATFKVPLQGCSNWNRDRMDELLYTSSLLVHIQIRKPLSRNTFIYLRYL